MRKNLISLFTGLCLSFLMFTTRAQATTSIDVQTFNPSTSDHFVFLEDGFASTYPKKTSFYFGANYNYVYAPLVVLDSTQTNKLYNIIDSIQTLDLFIGYKISNRVGIFVGAPIHYISYSSQIPATVAAYYPSGTSTSFGDLKLEGKIRVTDDDSPTSLAFIPEVHFPTGDSSNFVSDSSLYMGLRVALERKFESFTLLGNLGFVSASNSIYSDSNFTNSIDYRKRLITGIGMFAPFNDTWGLNVEFNNTSMLPFDKNLNPNDAYLGLRYATNDNWVFTGGASLGRIGGAGGQDYRVIGGIRYVLAETEKEEPKPIALPSPTPVATPTPTPIVATPKVIDSNKNAIMNENEIKILSPIHFENNSYKLAADSRQILDDVASLMLNHSDAYKKIQIDGHTSLKGKDAYNLKLSLNRAKSVKAYLTKKGIPESALEARGFGLRKPKAPQTEPNADEINRRVEFNIVK